MPTNRTDNYALSQWERSDRIQMEDFNSDNLKLETALAAQARSEGHQMSEQAQSELNSFLAQINSGWINYGYSSRDDLVRASFGAHMTYDRLVELMTQGYLAGDYANATVTVCHSRTADLAAECRSADFLFLALGRPRFITADMVSEGAVVIDVGTTRVPDATRKSGFRLRGDVDYENVAPKCAAITPVPGGVGPMTIVSLMLNTLQAAQNRD